MSDPNAGRPPSEASTHWGAEPALPESAERQQIRKRIEKRRKLANDLIAYVVVNAFLVAVWAFTGHGYFWPAWVMAAWGMGLVLATWDAYGRRPVSDADIDAELRKQHR
jgi:hypothetical protein